MAEGQDAEQACALAVVAGVVTLVIAGVLALAAARSLDRPMSMRPALAPAPAMASQVYGPGEHIVFDEGSAALPADAMEPIARIAEAARINDGAAVLISVHHRAGDATPAQRELVQRRALALRHALEADGVPAARVLVAEPLPAAAAADPSDARRAELQLR